VAIVFELDDIEADLEGGVLLELLADHAEGLVHEGQLVLALIGAFHLNGTTLEGLLANEHQCEEGVQAHLGRSVVKEELILLAGPSCDDLDLGKLKLVEDVVVEKGVVHVDAQLVAVLVEHQRAFLCQQQDVVVMCKRRGYNMILQVVILV
jgi:uncharacterized membrane protein (Fun14 family)